MNAEAAQAPGGAVGRGLLEDLIGGSFVHYLNTRPQLVIVGERLKLRILFLRVGPRPQTHVGRVPHAPPGAPPCVNCHPRRKLGRLCG